MSRVDFDAATTRASKRRRPVAFALVAAGAVAAITAGALLVGLDSRPQPTQVVPLTTSSPVNPPAPPRVTKSIDLGQEEQYPAAVAVTPGFVSVLALPSGRDREWVTSYSTGQAAFPVTQVSLPDDGPLAIVGDANALWVSSQLGEQSAHVFRIAQGAIAATVTTEGDSAIALTPSTVWVLDDKGELLRLDPRNASVVSRLALGGGGYGPQFISAGPLGVWLANSGDGSIWRAAPDGHAVRRVTTVGAAAGGLTQVAQRVWVATTNGITAIDPKTGRTTSTIELHRQVVDVVNDGHFLWVATAGPRLYRIDPTTGRTENVTLPRDGPILSLAGDQQSRAVWVVTAGTHSGGGLCHTDCPKLLRVGS